ncbi:MAG TPA: hypothetical protein VK179_04425, partial [Bacteroidales bacterium]|nr:hypothetical protein [Bacteroidales bacterium]
MKVYTSTLIAGFFLMTLLLFTQISLSQTLPTDYFRSRADGNWVTASTWESSSNNQDWQPATLFPDVTSQSIVIRHNIQFSSSNTIINADQILIESNGTLTTTSDRLVIVDGPGIDLDCSGTVTLGKYMSLIQAVMRNGGQYIRKLDNSVPLTIFTWEPGSTLRLVTMS